MEPPIPPDPFDDDDIPLPPTPYPFTAEEDFLDAEDLQWLTSTPPPNATSFESGQDISKQETSNLKNDVPRSHEATAREKQHARALNAHVNRIIEDNARRKWFFRFALTIAGVPVLVASVTMLVLLVAGNASETIVVAYFVSVVLEVIGISAIIARYLFPEGGPNANELPGETPDPPKK